MTRREKRKTLEWEYKKRDMIKLQLRFRVILVATIAVIIVFGIMGYALMGMYKDAILNVYAAQQDNYVQLVVDQINLQDDRTDESIISDIIDTLDSGNTHYWTLAKSGNMLFVKNVTETNKYQGAIMEDFFDTATADKFVEELNVNRAAHDIIKMNGQRYVVSGAVFEYNRNEYSLCLLTDETVILDNNDFLSTRIALYIYVIFIMLLLLLAAMVAEAMVMRREEDNNMLKGRLELQNQHINRLELEAKQRDSFNTRYNAYNESLLGEFAKRLDERGLDKAVLVRIDYTSVEDAKKFLIRAATTLDETVIRFKNDTGRVSLIMTCFDEKMAVDTIARFEIDSRVNVVMEDVAAGKESISEAYEKMYEEEM
ncbi:MAG: hypothetical protein IJ655_01140 [Lachnospiraceae bacterium]|nr:hypothetical protein [Lachnospiraceae bacterium]